MPVKHFLFLVVLIFAACKSPEHVTGGDTPEFAAKAKNIILIIGDGMGLSQISASVLSDKRSVFKQFPYVGFQKTNSADNLVTDSAAGATAMACGQKTNNNFIAAGPEGKSLQTIVELSEEKGLATGLVVTCPLTHATPAAFYAHNSSRWNSEELATSLVSSDIDFVVGGGLTDFRNRESDNRNLVKELRNTGYNVDIYEEAGPIGFYPKKNKNYACFTSTDKPTSKYNGRDYLPLAASAACDFLNEKNDQGFFLMVEASQIDWACHANNQDILFKELEDLNETLSRILRFAFDNKETLVIVTADHETGGFGINPGSKTKHLKTEFTTNGHTGCMVPVFAIGPEAEAFEGVYENTAIYFKMREILFPKCDSI